jgi:capsular exopolysaccharide synthesis family protein
MEDTRQSGSSSEAGAHVPQVVLESGYRVEADDEGLLGIDLERIFAALRRNFLWIVGIVLGFLVLGAVITMLIVPRYIASATVLIEQETDQIIENTDLAPAVSYQDAERFLQTQLDVIQSRALAARVLEEQNLSDDPVFYDAVGSVLPEDDDLEGRYVQAGGIEALRRDTALDLLQENLSVSLPVDSRLAEIRFESSDSVLSTRIVNSFAENLIESNLGRKFDSSSYAREFLAQQLLEARQRLEESERDLNQYSRAAGLIRVAGQGQNADQENTLSVTNDSLVQINLAASQATANRVAAQEQWRSIASAPVLSVPQVLANPAVQGLIRQRSETQAALAQERARHLDEHPTVQALIAQLQQLDAQVQDVGASIKRSVYLDYQAALDREQALKGQVGELRSAALNEQDQGVQYNVLKRVAETNRSLYDTLLERFNELNATAGATSNNISLVDRADVPRVPSSPNLPLNMALAMLVGFVIAGGFVFVREQFDDTIRVPEDVEAKLGLTLLGLIPRGEDSEVTSAKQSDLSDIGEAYRSLVANLRFATSSGLPRSIVVTSAQAAEGKTTSAQAMAFNLARLGHNVLMIDADLRRPTLHNLLDVRPKHGLTEVLAGQVSLDEAVYPSEFATLFYLTAVPIPSDPSLVLGSPRLAEVIVEARSKYDVVVIDSPPTLGLADAPNLAVNADAVIFVIDGSRSHRGAVKAALRRLEIVHANILGAVLTKFDPKAAGARYDYYAAGYYSYGKNEPT